MSCRPATLKSDSCYIRQRMARKPDQTRSQRRYRGCWVQCKRSQGVPWDYGGSSTALWCYVIVMCCNSDVMRRYSACCINAGSVTIDPEVMRLGKTISPTSSVRSPRRATGVVPANPGGGYCCGSSVETALPSRNLTDPCHQILAWIHETQ